MKEIKLIIFDMDGLLLDTESIANEAWYKAAEIYHFNLTEDIIRNIKGATASAIYNIVKKFTGTKTDEFLLKKKELEKIIIQEKGIKLKKGALELLKYLKGKNIPTIVATSTYKSVAEKELKETEIYNYFTNFIYGDEVVNGKPNPEIFLKACRKFNVLPENAVVFEDSVLGLKAAIAGNIRCIVVEDTIKLTAEENKLTFKKFNSLLEAVDFFENIF
ncbi:HAD family phosphatase [Fusobacterium sp. SB021]|uniref:HAD family hydrolase n=1 Tax=Fusobacterium sp. SB021 TaxID=2744227 RepID=UPI003CE8C8F7